MKEDIAIHKNSPSLHIISGLIAFFVYLLMIILLIAGFRFHKEKMKYGEEPPKAEVLLNESIELADVAPQEDDTLQKVQQTTTQDYIPQKQTKEQIEKKIESIEKNVETTKEKTLSNKQTLVEKPKDKDKQKINLNDVFANVPSKTSQDIRKEEEEKRQKELIEAKRLRDEAKKVKQEQLTQNALALEQSAKALQQATQNLKTNIKQAMTTKILLEKPRFSGNTEDKKKYDEWYAKIEQILINEWQKSGSFYKAATSAKVRIKIDAGGKLTYLYMISQSPYSDYNNSVIEFLRKMETRLFPPPPAESVDMSMELENILRH